METTNIAGWKDKSDQTVFFVLATSDSEAKKILKKGHSAEFTLTHLDVARAVPVPGATSTAPASSTKGGGTNSTNLPVILKTIGVLGKTPNDTGPIAIPDNHIVVDPAGLLYITGTSSINLDADHKGGAGGLSGPIYAHYHIKDSNGSKGLQLNDHTGAGFPEKVQTAITKEGQAFAHEYYEGAVIHVVGPDFRNHPTISLGNAVVKLTEAYYNVIYAAENLCKSNEDSMYNAHSVVRLPLISMGVFVGKFVNDKQELTARAVIKAFARYKTNNVSTLQYWMCLYTKGEDDVYKKYKSAFETALIAG